MVAFPRQSVVWKLEDVTTLRRVSLSLGWYGIGIGAILRLYRWGVLAVLAPEGWGAILGALGFGVILMCGLVTGHLANHSLKSWKWRVPAMGAWIAFGESITSLLLTVVRQERLGRAPAMISDWPGTAFGILWSRMVVVTLFALALSAVVILLRRAADAKGG
jgi:hypothetical protein